MNNKTHHTISQETQQRLNHLQRVSSIWNYWETFASVTLVILGGVVLLADNSYINGALLVLTGSVLFLFAELRKLHNVTLFHVSSLLDSSMGQIQIIASLDLTLGTLGLYDKANKVLELGESNESLL